MQRNVILVLSVIALFLLGAIGFVVYRQSVDDFMAVEPESVEETEEGLELEEETEEVEVEPGTYVVYETTTVTDRGEEDWANDDTHQVVYSWYRMEDGERMDFASVVRDQAAATGSLVAYPFGQQILVHRYGLQEQDAVLSLDGTVTQEDGSHWNRLRSKDGTIEVTWGNNEVEEVAWMTVSRNGAEVARTRIDRETLDTTQGPSVAFPTGVSEDNRFVYLVKGPYEGPGYYTVWRFDIEENAMHRLSYLDENQIAAIHINYATNQLLGTAADLSDANIGGVPAGTASQLHLIDLVADTGEVIRENDSFYLNRLFLAPSGNYYSYHVDDADAIWLDAIEDDGIDADFPISGNVLAWVDGALVILRDNDLVTYSLTSGDVVTIESSVGEYQDPDHQRMNFVGVIEIE